MTKIVCMKSIDLDISILQLYICAIQMGIVVHLLRMQKFTTPKQFLGKKMLILLSDTFG